MIAALWTLKTTCGWLKFTLKTAFETLIDWGIGA